MSNATQAAETDRGADGLVVVSWANPDGSPSETRFGTPGEWIFVVPDGVTVVEVVARGASGGDGLDRDGKRIPGHVPGEGRAVLPVMPGEALPVVVPRGGAHAVSPNRGGAGGGSAGFGNVEVESAFAPSVPTVGDRNGHRVTIRGRWYNTGHAGVSIWCEPCEKYVGDDDPRIARADDGYEDDSATVEDLFEMIAEHTSRQAV